MKNPIFRLVHEKPTNWGVDCLKRGAWTVWRFKRGLGKKEGVMLLKGGLRPQCTLRVWRRSLLIDPMVYRHKMSKANNIA